MSIIYRNGLGRKLTPDEVDGNFQYLDDNKVEQSDIDTAVNNAPVSPDQQAALDLKADQTALDTAITTQDNVNLAQDSVNTSDDNRITNLEANQIDGVLSYETLASLPATGTVQKSYKVTNDSTPSKNGYYHWNGSAYIKDADLVDFTEVISSNVALPERIVYDKFIAVDGTINTGAGWAYIDIPIVEAQQVTFGNFSIDVNGHAAFYNGATLVSYAGSYTTGQLPKTFTAPAGVTRILIDIKRPANTAANFANLIVNYGATLLPYETPYFVVTKYNGREIQARKLSSNNITPTPTTDLNAVNKSYFETNALLKSEIDSTPSTNLGYLPSLLDNKALDGAGTLIDLTGYKTFPLAVTEAEVVSFGNFSIAVNGRASFYNNGALVSLVSTYTTAQLPIQNIVVPAGVDTLYIMVKRDTNVLADYENLIITKGATLAGYTDPRAVITEVDGKRINDFVGDVAIQNEDASFAALYATGLSLVIPQGAGSPPVGVEINDAWIDTNDSTVKVRLV